MTQEVKRLSNEETYDLLCRMAKEEDNGMAKLFVSMLEGCHSDMRNLLLQQAGDALVFANEIVRRSDDPEFAAEMMRQAKR